MGCKAIFHHTPEVPVHVMSSPGSHPFTIKLLCPCALRLRGLGQSLRLWGAAFFSWKFSHKMDLVTCPCACQSRRLTKCARQGSQALCLRYFHFKSYINGPCGDLAKFLSKRSLHDAVQVLNRRSCGDPGGILPQGSLHEDIADDMS